MTNIENLCIFPDTNVFLHFKPIADIDWCRITGKADCRIVIAPIVIAELERAKALNAIPKLRERASRAIAELLNAANSGDSHALRSNVSVEFLDHEPMIDFVTERLAFELGDDRLIASALEFHSETGHQTAIATADSGLIIKLRKRSISAITLPDTARLPSAADGDRKELAKLKQQLAKIEARLPKLRLRFIDGNQNFQFDITKPKRIPVSLGSMRIKFPPLSADTYDAYELKLPAHRPRVRIIDQEAITQYNIELEKYFEMYGLYAQEFGEWAEDDTKYVKVQFVIANIGSGPSTNIDIDIPAPDGCEWAYMDERPEAPDAPTIPDKPRTDRTQAIKFGEPVALGWPNANLPVQPLDDGEVEIMNSGSLLHYRMSALKHDCAVHLDPVLLYMPNFDSAAIIEAITTCNEADKVADRLALSPKRIHR